MSAAFQTPRGTLDWLPAPMRARRRVVEAARSVFERAGYREVSTPVFEDTGLFLRTSGEGSEVVQKEMYSFVDRSDRPVSLRPELTAPLVRAYLQHGLARLPQPVKLWTVGACYRYNAVQRGRLREFTQFDAEAIGSTDPAVDAELIALQAAWTRDLGLEGVELELNSIGDSADRPAYLARLVEYLDRHLAELHEDVRRQRDVNPLRAFDTKDERSRAIMAAAPTITEHLSDAAREHFEAVRDLLDARGVAYRVEPALVRGLDYYNRTTWEFTWPALGAQSTIGGGGRYDGLAEAIGGAPTAGVGFGAGVERLLLALGDEEGEAEPPADVFFAILHPPARPRLLALLDEVRSAGLRGDADLAGRGTRGQFKQADRLGARLTVVCGEDEWQRGVAAIRDMTSGEQVEAPLDGVVRALAEEDWPVTYRTAGCGELGTERVGEAVTISGWVGRRRDHGGLVFIDLRDRSGVVQVVIDPADAHDAHAAAHDLRVEAVVRVEGDVVARSAETVNPRLATGEVEVRCRALTVLGPADPLPFQLDDENVDETLRLRHRALDLRRPAMTERLRIRAQVARLMRRHLEDRGFWEVETPVLGKSTPEGARDFLVPARTRPGSFYALPQSPQLYKQLTQLAGVERYYQIARCFRDEAQRADRQLEFTQLDVEMSFVTEDDVMELMEGVYARIWRELLGAEIPLPLLRLTYAEAMLRFGTDRPDLRFGLEIADVTELVRDSGFAVFGGAAASGGVVRALACPGAAALVRRELDELAAFAKEWGGKGLAYLLLEPSGELRSPIAKFLSEAELAGIREATGAGPGDAVFLAADTAAVVERVLGALRPHLAQRFGLVPEGAWKMCWVVDFPAFRYDADEGRWAAVHHAFTAPKPEHEELLASDPGAVLSQAYDLVVNGHEAGGGSIRINRPELQQRALAAIGIGAEDAEARFGFLLRALRFGAPPHGGIAMGLDRCVMLLAGTDNIRDVIAFPKVAGGFDPLTDAPTPVDREQLDDLGLAVKAPPAAGGGGGDAS